MPAHAVPIAADDVPPNRRRGGDIRVLLSPSTVGATSGFMGVLRLASGEHVTEHYHPYSEEFVYLVDGALQVRLDGVAAPLAAGQALLIPRNVRHRLTNSGDTPCLAVFHLCPLAPRPELGHVDTEPVAQPAVPGPDVGAAT